MSLFPCVNIHIYSPCTYICNLYTHIYIISIHIQKCTLYTPNFCAQNSTEKSMQILVHIKTLVLGAGANSAVRSNCCSCQGCKFISSTIQLLTIIYNSDSNGIWDTIPSSGLSGTRHIHDTHAYMKAKFTAQNIFKRLQFLKTKITAQPIRKKQIFLFQVWMLFFCSTDPFQKFIPCFSILHYNFNHK